MRWVLFPFALLVSEELKHPYMLVSLLVMLKTQGRRGRKRDSLAMTLTTASITF